MEIIDYNGLSIFINSEDGFINMTKLCKSFNTNINDWIKSELAEKIIEEVNAQFYKGTNGIYFHQDVVPFIAMWISCQPGNNFKITNMINRFIIEYNCEPL